MLQRITEIIEKLNIERKVAFEFCNGNFVIPLAKIFEKVYVVSDFKTAETLRKKLENLNINNVGIIVSEGQFDIDFKVNLVLFSNTSYLNKYVKLARKADYVIVIGSSFQVILI